MGDILVKNRNVRGLLKGLRNTKDGNVPVTFFNDHSDGISKYLYWFNSYRKRKQATVWLFGGHRKLRRGLAARLIAGQQYPDYTKLLKLK